MLDSFDKKSSFTLTFCRYYRRKYLQDCLHLLPIKSISTYTCIKIRFFSKELLVDELYQFLYNK